MVPKPSDTPSSEPTEDAPPVEAPAPPPPVTIPARWRPPEQPRVVRWVGRYVEHR